MTTDDLYDTNQDTYGDCINRGDGARPGEPRRPTLYTADIELAPGLTLSGYTAAEVAEMRARLDAHDGNTTTLNTPRWDGPEGKGKKSARIS